MAKVELKYNPYLVETEIIFNGIKPRINSLVEKYQHESLQFWVRKVPYIFHDEMNGYDFDLEFSGTNTDFEVFMSVICFIVFRYGNSNLITQCKQHCPFSQVRRVTSIQMDLLHLILMYHLTTV